MRVSVRIVIGLLALVAGTVTAVGEEVTVAGTTCMVLEQVPPAGPRLWIFGEPVIEVDGTQACYVGQGWAALPTCFSEIDATAVRGAIKDYWQCEHTTDGAVIAPDYVMVYWFAPSGPLGDPRDATSEDKEIYIVRWVFAFSAGHFEPGIYIFESTWNVPVPCDVCSREERDERTAISGSRSSTVAITYPVD